MINNSFIHFRDYIIRCSRLFGYEGRIERSKRTFSNSSNGRNIRPLQAKDKYIYQNLKKIITL
jgi:hypothetical protein